MNNLNLEGITYGSRDEKPTTSHQEANDDTKYIHHIGNNEHNLVTLLSEVADEEDDHETILTELSAINSQSEQLESNTQMDDEDWPEGDDINVTLAMNEACTHLITEMINKIERALQENHEKQKALVARQTAMREAANMKKKMPVQMFLPPYFKDEHNMCPALSDEAKDKLNATDYDPLAREEKKWNATEVTRLKNYIRKAMLDIYIEPLVSKRDELFNNVRTAGVEIPQAQIQSWREEWEQTVRKINFHSQMTIEDLCATINADEIDWAKMANIDFGGLRTPASLRLKWFNEVSPRWNQKAWSKEEAVNLKKLVENDMFITWQVVAEKLGTNRTAWQCFEKYKSEIYQNTKPWSPEEDEKLITLCSIIKIGNEIQWDKVSYYMPGRNRQQVRVRYLRSLDKSIKHGKWTDQEDLLLLCAVNRIGARNWKQIAANVPGRTDTQCRERWTSVLDKKASAKEWTMEDDEKLLFLVNTLGRSNWSKFNSFLDRTADQCRYRFQSLLTQKISHSLKQKPQEKIENLGDYEKRNINRKLRLNRIYRKYDNMMASITANPNDEGIDKMMEAVHANQRPPASIRRQVDPETVGLINAELMKISEKYMNMEPVDMSTVLQQIVVLDSDLKQWQKRRSNMSRQKKDKVDITADNRRKRTVPLRKHLHENPKIKEYHDKLIDSSATEEEKVDGMYDVLVNCVNRMDTQEFYTDFTKYWNESGALIATDIGIEMLTSNLESDVNELKAGRNLNFQSTLPINWANSDVYADLQKSRPFLLKKANELFIRADASVKDPLFQMNLIQNSTLEPTSSLYIPLSKEITESEAYLKTKILMRNVLIEPIMYEAACLDEKRMEILERNQRNLEERAKEDEQIKSGEIPMPQRLTADEIKERLMKDPKMPNVKDKRLKKKSAEPSANNAEKSDRVTRSSDAAAENEQNEDDLILSIRGDEINVGDDVELPLAKLVQGEPEKRVTRAASRQEMKSLETSVQEASEKDDNEDNIAGGGSEINVEEDLEDDQPLVNYKKGDNKTMITRSASERTDELFETSPGKSKPKRKGAPKKHIEESSDDEE